MLWDLVIEAVLPLRMTLGSRQRASPLLIALLVGLTDCGGRAAAEAPGTEAGGTVAVGRAGSVGTAGAAGAESESQGGSVPVAWTACAKGDHCVLETQTACGAGCEPVPLSRFTAINAAFDTQYRMQQLNPPCIETRCSVLPLGDANTPNYYAACEAHHCKAFDVRESALSACSEDSDCSLRAGVVCGCASSALVAVSNAANVDQVLCGAAGGCAGNDCVVRLPADTTAEPVCAAGHCAVRYAFDAGAGF